MTPSHHHCIYLKIKLFRYFLSALHFILHRYKKLLSWRGDSNSSYKIHLHSSIGLGRLKFAVMLISNQRRPHVDFGPCNTAGRPFLWLILLCMIKPRRNRSKAIRSFPILPKGAFIQELHYKAK